MSPLHYPRRHPICLCIRDAVVSPQDLFYASTRHAHFANHVAKPSHNNLVQLVYLPRFLVSPLVVDYAQVRIGW